MTMRLPLAALAALLDLTPSPGRRRVRVPELSPGAGCSADERVQ